MKKVVALVQARMGSQRLPGKVLKVLPGAGVGEEDLRVLDWVVRRTRAARLVDEVIVATSVDEEDDQLAAFCAQRNYQFRRGSRDDVLSRLAEAAIHSSADVVVRITADCPLIDPEVIDAVVREHLDGGHQFTANRLPPPAVRTFPIGLDVEVADVSSLLIADSAAVGRARREHVMPYLYETPEMFDVFIMQTGDAAGSVRWTVDTSEDLLAIRSLVEASGATTSTPWRVLLSVWRSHPELAVINRGVRQRSATDTDPRG